MQLMRFKLKMSRISHIFISHLHGDHYYGIFGLISSLHLEGRTEALHIFAHPDLADILLAVQRISEGSLSYELVFHAVLPVAQTVWENEVLRVRTIPLSHSLPTVGYCFEEKKTKINVKKEFVKDFSVEEILQIKAGKDIEKNGLILKNQDLSQHTPQRSYAFCSDTMYSESILEHIQNVDLLYHEATFLEEDAHKAQKTCHSTARQAAQIAQQANAKKLLIGHFSARYRNDEALLEEAKAVFENTEIAEEGKIFEL